ncbi:MAG TPA: hypothetical protein VFV78_01675 [Vicinamibacterales bacterium]|nr:hypothetical protein [Vicinamibacterales bacterium]
MALLALITTMLLGSIGLGLVTVTSTEAAMASNHRESSEMLHAAEAAAELASAEVIRAASWNDVLSGVTSSAFTDGTTTPRLASGEVLNLASLTTAWQAASDAEARHGLNNPRWRLFLYQPLASITHASASSQYVIAWVADDLAETDNDPLTDGNGIVLVRAQAAGRLGMARTIDVSIAKKDLGIGIASWRVVQ